jgi:hypothetical protein
MEGHGNRAKGKVVQSVIARRLEERAAIAVIVDALIDKAMDGDLAAAKEIFDRIDGKPKQQTEVTGLDDSPLFKAVEIRLRRPDASP